MNNDILKGSLKELKGKAKILWGKLSDDEISKIDGKKDEFIGSIQKKYGYSQEEARSKVNDFLKETNGDNNESK